MKRTALLSDGSAIVLTEDFIVKNNMLYNTKISRYEALPKDAIKVKIDGEICRYIMKGNSNGNFFPTKNGDLIYNGSYFQIIHKTFITSVVEEPDDEPKAE